MIRITPSQIKPIPIKNKPTSSINNVIRGLIGQSTSRPKSKCMVKPYRESGMTGQHHKSTINNVIRGLMGQQNTRKQTTNNNVSGQSPSRNNHGVTSYSKSQITATRSTPYSIRKVMAVSNNKNKNMYSVDSMIATKNSKEFTRMRLSSNQIANYLRDFDKLSNTNGPYISNKSKAPVRKPVTKKPVTKKPVTKKPVTKKPVTKKPVTKKPVTKKPVTKKPVTKKVSIKKRLTKIINNNK